MQHRDKWSTQTHSIAYVTGEHCASLGNQKQPEVQQYVFVLEQFSLQADFISKFQLWSLGCIAHIFLLSHQLVMTCSKKYLPHSSQPFGREEYIYSPLYKAKH